MWRPHLVLTLSCAAAQAVCSTSVSAFREQYSDIKINKQRHHLNLFFIATNGIPLRIVDIAYYANLPQATKESGAGTVWLVSAPSPSSVVRLVMPRK